VNLRPVEMKGEAGIRVAAGKVATIPVAVTPEVVDTQVAVVDIRVAAAAFPEVVVALDSRVAALVSLVDAVAVDIRVGPEAAARGAANR
jgi:hypothetical protein